MAPPILPQRLRKFIGLFLLLGVLGIYIFAAVTIGVLYINDLGIIAQLPYYIVAGMGWALPARPVVRWMQRPDA